MKNLMPNRSPGASFLARGISSVLLPGYVVPRSSPAIRRPKDESGEHDVKKCIVYPKRA